MARVMKQTGFFLFLSVVLTVYALVNFYIIRRGWQALPAGSIAKPIFLVSMLFLILAYPLGRICERCLSSGLGAALIHIGSYYLAIMIFSFIVLILIDIVRLIDLVLPFIDKLVGGSMPRLRLYLFFITGGLAMFFTLIGAVNARHPRPRMLQLEIDKPCSYSQLRIALFSDMHLGTLIPVHRMKKLAQAISSYSPDLILIAGDLFDEDAVSLKKKSICDGLQLLKAPLGVYAIAGNHEYYGGIESSIALMEKSGITVLRDRCVKIADVFYLIGRDDRTLNQFGGKRLSLDSLLADVDRSLPIIMMDHQPFHLEEAQRCGIDLQLSGHTHHGQIFPFNFITKRVYELSWGYKQKGTTHIYVSCGAGTWGPPVRLGNIPEFVIIDCVFKKNELQDL